MDQELKELELLIERMHLLNRILLCRENSLVITNLEQALLWVLRRRQLRDEAGVRGTMFPVPQPGNAIGASSNMIHIPYSDTGHVAGPPATTTTTPGGEVSARVEWAKYLQDVS